MANFTGSPLSGCSPVIVVFQDQSTGNPTSWNWDFGNGNTSTLQNPTATYFNPGTYTVSLTATNANGSNSITRQQLVTVYEPPVVNFTADVTSGCFPLRVNFTDLSNPGNGNTNVAWQWDFGNGATSTLQNPQTTYITSGVFTVTLKVTNDKGCTRTLSRPNFITVTNGVHAGFTNTAATVCTAPVTLSFTNNSTGPPVLSYQWDFGDGGTSTLQNPTYTYNTNGTYTITLVTSSSAGCQDTARNTITIGGFVSGFSAPPAVCINQPASFINLSVPTPNASFWVFGDGGTANTINASHVYTAAGIYTVKLYNTFTSCTDSVIQTITVNPKPVANFTAPVTTRCGPPLTVNFQDLSTGAVGWQWDFGDGGTSSLQNPSHTYTNYGSFTVTLIATNAAGCADTLVRSNYVRIQRPVISIAPLPVEGCLPYTLTPVATVTSFDVVTSYAWDFGDGGTSALPNPTHTYTVQGSYTVKLYITTSGGCTDSLIMPAAVRVGNKPTANFSATPLLVCARKEVYFTDLTTPAADEWHWDFGDGTTSNQQNPVHNYNDTGYMNIQLIVKNFGCPDTITRINYLYVKPPIAAFTPASNCANRLFYTFTDHSVGPLTWEWDFGDGSPASFIQNPTHTYAALGVYSVRLIVTNNGCADTSVQTIHVVDEVPDFNADKLAACKVALISFATTNVNFANITSYAWTFGDGGSATVGFPGTNYNYTTSGTFTVSLTITDINGCTSSVTKNNYIRINGPVANFTELNTSGCAGLTTTFTDLSTGDGANSLSSWQWNFGDGNTQLFNAPPFQHTYAAAGTYSVQLIVTDAIGCKDSITKQDLIVTTDPVPDFVTADTLTCPGALVTFTNNSLPANMSWQWAFGDGNTSTLAAPTHIYTTTGLYDVTLHVLDAIGCADSLRKQLYIKVDTPKADFMVSDSISSCLPFEVTFTNTSTYYSAVHWDFGPGQGVSTLPSPVHYYSVGGIYPVKLIVTSPGGCMDSITKNIYVYDTVGSALRYLPLNGCKPLTVSLNTLTNGPMASYFWDFGDGNIQSTSSPNASHIYTSFGNFLPKVIMQDPSGCLIPLPGPDTVYVTGANTKFGYSDSLFCDRGVVNFTDSTTFNDPVQTYHWEFGDGATSAVQNPSHFYSGPGIYTVQLSVLTQLGCRDTLTKPLLVKVVQRPLIDIAGDSVICVGKSLIHSGIFIQPDTSVVHWQWTFPTGNNYSVQNPPAQTYTTAGNFIITTIATNSTGCKDTSIQNIHVNPLPAVNLPSQLTVQNGFPVMIPATYSSGTNTWLWSPANGLDCFTCATPMAGPKFDTRYQVFFTDSNGCSNKGSILVLVICKNSNLFVPNTFSPNADGSNDVFYPRGRGLERVKALRIFDRWGELVFERINFPVNDAASGWDGKYKGKPPKADVYIWQIDVFCENGDTIKLTGNVSLVL